MLLLRTLLCLSLIIHYGILAKTRDKSQQSCPCAVSQKDSKDPRTPLRGILCPPPPPGIPGPPDPPKGPPRPNRKVIGPPSRESSNPHPAQMLRTDGRTSDIICVDTGTKQVKLLCWFVDCISVDKLLNELTNHIDAVCS